jgi:hypothetical protein
MEQPKITHEQIDSLKERIKDSLGKVLRFYVEGHEGEEMTKRMEDFGAKLIDFSSKLEEQFSDYESYAAYHFLISSTPKDSDTISHLDFEGEYNVEAFLKEILGGE